MPIDYGSLPILVLIAPIYLVVIYVGLLSDARLIYRLLYILACVIYLFYGAVIEPLRQSNNPYTWNNILISTDTSFGLLCAFLVQVIFITIIINFSQPLWAHKVDKLPTAFYIITGTIMALYLGWIGPLLSICTIGPWASGSPYPNCSIELSTVTIFAQKEAPENGIEIPNGVTVSNNKINPINSPVRFTYMWVHLTNEIIALGANPLLSRIFNALIWIGALFTGIDYLFIKIPRWIRKRFVKEK
ncbi:MAG: hypothetical protein ACOYZ8_04130 [Chloroflexota bacterium]